MNDNYQICESMGSHSNAIMEYQCEKVYKLTCPLCGYSTLITDDEIVEGIVEALTESGRYKNIERIK